MTPHVRGLKKSSPLTLRIIEFVKKHKLYHPDTTIQTYMHYIRNNVTCIPVCKVCNNHIPNLALGSNRAQLFCSKKCQGINQRGPDYKAPIDVLKYTDAEVFELVSSKKSFSGMIKSVEWGKRAAKYIKDNTNLSPDKLTQNEILYVIRRGLKDLPQCINCNTPIRIVPQYNITGNGRNVFNILCTECHKKTSSHEKIIQQMITRMGVQYECNKRSILNNHKELDIYIPNKNVAIEINGLYWHSEVQNNYNKLSDCTKQGIRLIQIYTDEIDTKSKIVYYRLRSILGLVKYKIGARECEVREIERHVKSKFLNKYHLQGNDKAQKCFGLFYKNRLVSVMTFSLPRIVTGQTKASENTWELSRFALINSFYIIGGAGKILNHFIQTYKPSKLYSYCDLRWSEGGVYKATGFNLIKSTKPNYWYCLAPHYKERHHRFNFRKSELKSKLKLFDNNLTEIENMTNNKHYRVFDSGHLLFEKKIL